MYVQTNDAPIVIADDTLTNPAALTRSHSISNYSGADYNAVRKSKCGAGNGRC